MTHPKMYRDDDPGLAELLLRDERFFVPACYGPHGWLGLDLAAGPTDWLEVRELVETSYRNTAPPKSVRRLGMRGAPQASVCGRGEVNVSTPKPASIDISLSLSYSAKEFAGPARSGTQGAGGWRSGVS